MPEYPSVCREKVRSGVQLGDGRGAALLKTDAALTSQHARVNLCAEWYDKVRAGRSNDHRGIP
ncbi:hypothetical protein RKLH11_522 [Rhodobacteraceae bacterium KLH11]|nr:hypothetical protein RKLH11_522 [Rhodobacteraceae bacterium KLH11]